MFEGLRVGVVVCLFRLRAVKDGGCARMPRRKANMRSVLYDSVIQALGHPRRLFAIHE